MLKAFLVLLHSYIQILMLCESVQGYLKTIQHQTTQPITTRSSMVECFHTISQISHACLHCILMYKHAESGTSNVFISIE